MNCRHCGREVADGLLQTNQEWVCTGCGAELYSIQAIETVSMPGKAEGDRLLLPERFVPREPLGKGSFGAVISCWDKSLQRLVAVKLPRREDIQMDIMLREARIASKLQHENIVRIFDVGEHRGKVFIVSELIRGVSLSAWQDRQRRGVDTILRVCVQIARAIDYAHRQGVIHRDLKPGNILVDEQDCPRILDFGLSRSLGSSEDSVLTPGQPIGTPAFMAPEQVRGDADAIDARTDVYAIGVMLYRLLMGRLPFQGSVADVYAAILDTRHEPEFAHRGIPGPLLAVCRKAMDRERDRRYGSAGEMADDLDRYLAGQRMSAYPALYPRRVKRLVGRYGALGLAMAAMILGVVALLLWKQERAANRPMIPVMIDTEPSGGQLVWRRLDPETGLPSAEPEIESVGGSMLSLAPGFYRVVATCGDDFVEVFRSVPEDPGRTRITRQLIDCRGYRVLLRHRSYDPLPDGKGIKLLHIRCPKLADVGEQMEIVAGGTFATSPAAEFVMPQLTRPEETVGDFLIDQKEVTWGDLKKVWKKIRIEPGEEDLPVTGLTWDQAVVWAEESGKSLPEWQEIYWVASRQHLAGNDTAKTSEPASSGGEVAESGGNTEAAIRGLEGVQDLMGGVSEWTNNPFSVVIWNGKSLEPVPRGNGVPSIDPQTWPDRAIFVDASRFQESGSVSGSFFHDQASVLSAKHPGMRGVRRLKPATFPP